TAETTAGELLIQMKQSGERPAGRKKESHVATLSDLKITKTQSSRWQKRAILKKNDPKQWQVQLDKTIRMAGASCDGNKEIVREARADMRGEKFKKRAAHEEAITAKIKALPQKKYAVIYADPEWKFKTWDGLSTGAQHYAVSDLETIKARDVPSIS